MVDAISIDGDPIAGQALHVAWDVINADLTNTVSYAYKDVVYLSKDDIWDIDNIALATVQRQDTVAPLGGYHVEQDVILPGVLPGEHYILVRTDHKHAPQGHTAASPITLGIQELTLATSSPGEFSSQERSRYYKVTTVAGEDLVINLDDLDDTGSNKMYVGFESVPTRSQFDYLHAFSFAPDQEIVISDTQEGTYYILLYAEQIPSGVPSSYTILAQYVPLQVTGITPTSGGNTGQVTISLKGTRFTEDTQVILIGSENQQLDAVATYFTDSTEMDATFDLNGAIPGVYSLSVNNSSESVILPNVFSVVQGGTASFEARIVAPSAVRGMGSQFTFYVEYENKGTVDMPAPILLLETDVPFWVREYPETKVISMQVLGVSFSGPAGVLSPGSVNRIGFYSTAPAQMKLKSITTSDVPIEWFAMYPERRPPFIDESYWEEHWEDILTQVGNTWSEYVSNLATHVTTLSEEQARPVLLVEDIYLSLVETLINNNSTIIRNYTVASLESSGTSFSPPVPNYDRDAARSQATSYATKVCPDGVFFWGGHTDNFSPGTPLSQVLANKPDPSLADQGNDCAHFVSCCLAHVCHLRS